jgi:dolichyl-phosphate-mannose--protein O-mannosyl transferase
LDWLPTPEASQASTSQRTQGEELTSRTDVKLLHRLSHELLQEHSHKTPSSTFTCISHTKSSLEELK